MKTFASVVVALFTLFAPYGAWAGMSHSDACHIIKLYHATVLETEVNLGQTILRKTPVSKERLVAFLQTEVREVYPLVPALRELNPKVPPAEVYWLRAGKWLAHFQAHLDDGRGIEAAWRKANGYMPPLGEGLKKELIEYGMQLKCPDVWRLH
jgi:hypothetical protein